MGRPCWWRWRRDDAEQGVVSAAHLGVRSSGSYCSRAVMLPGALLLLMLKDKGVCVCVCAAK